MTMIEDKIKMYCIFSKEAIKLMNGNRGKLASMAGHAYLHAWWDALETYPAIVASQYKNSGWAAKITLYVETTEELTKFYESYKDKCGVSLVTDAGLTVFDGPTTVCLGIGPIKDSDVGDDLKTLKVLI